MTSPQHGNQSSSGEAIWQAEQLVDASKAVFVDVRPQHEYDQQHLPGAHSGFAILTVLWSLC